MPMAHSIMWTTILTRQAVATAAATPKKSVMWTRSGKPITAATRSSCRLLDGTLTRKGLITRTATGTTAAGRVESSLIRMRARERLRTRNPARYMATITTASYHDYDKAELPPRDSMPFDVLIVGGGPAGLAAAIRLKQLCAAQQHDLSVCVIDKGSEIGAHILSGNVFDPKALEELLPERSSDSDSDEHWTKDLLATQGSHATPVVEDQFLILTEKGGSYRIPNILLPPQLNNHGNYIISLSQLCRWLATKAEELGVEIYPGFAASEVLLTADGQAVRGVATRDVGIAKDGTLKPTFERGVELLARQTLLAEGARGPCSLWLEQKFQLRTGKHPQTYGIGLKEVWQVPPEIFQPGLVQHTLGFPLQKGPFDKVYGGSFLYHQEPDLVLAGIVVGLDYANPYLNPYQEFQRWKTHPVIRKYLEGGTCISYGARALNEGGYHSIPHLTVPGAVLLGCSAGLLNAVKIKGSHTALKSGMLAAEATFAALSKSPADEAVAATGEVPPNEAPIHLTSYEKAIRDSWIHRELYEIRNTHAAFHKWGVAAGLAYAGLAAHLTKGREPWTLSHTTTDSQVTGKAADYEPIAYPAADGKLTFDLLTNLQRSGTNHNEDQPSHLRIKPEKGDVPVHTSMQLYAAPETRFCPAAVYEYVDHHDQHNDNILGSSGPIKKLVINHQNCLHCFTCSIKTPEEYIEWTVPEGGGGPQYQLM